ncbi:MAG: hypothetical protein FWD25_09940 [Clostridia bacterium]|nr:hypothetical protein [Clostridia bacterium]
MPDKLAKTIFTGIATVTMALAADKEAKAHKDYEKLKSSEYSEKVKLDAEVKARTPPSTSDN